MQLRSIGGDNSRRMRERVTVAIVHVCVSVHVCVCQVTGDGVTILYNPNGHLVGSRSTKSSTTSWNELKFADDTAILSTSKEKIVHAMNTLFSVTSQWGLTISVPKTKAMVVSQTDSTIQELQFNTDTVEVVEEFKYLGSVLQSSGSAEADVKSRIDKASQAFGRLKRSVFQDKALSVTTKRVVYKAVVLGTLLYGSETWTTKRSITQKLETFHNRCLRMIFGITRTEQREKRISSSEIRERFGMKELIQEMVTLRRLRWLGHVARMGDNRMPKQALFGRLSRARPFHGVKLRWKDRVKKDLTSMAMHGHWYQLAQDRKKWHDRYHERMEQQIDRRLEQERAKRQASRRSEQTTDPSTRNFMCVHCHRRFRRSGDLKRHKCTTQGRTAAASSQQSSSARNDSAATFDCQQCSRSFRRPGDLKRHKCDSVRSRKARGMWEHW